MLDGPRLGTHFFLALAASAAFGGCAAVPVVVAGAGDINFTRKSAYRTFSCSRDQLHAAALRALAQMQITLLRDEWKGDKIAIRGKTPHLTIEIALAAITPSLIQASVDVKKNWFGTDNSVAAEILVQMNRILTRATAPSQK